MASSISHDLRHYISAMYANAEFLSLASTPQAEREELIFEVQTAVHGMTDLLDSLLGFSRTGKALLLTYESVPYLIERAAGLLRAHPEARSLDVCLAALPSVEAWVDATKIVRAVFNLLLNACQAANRGTLTPSVTLQLTEDLQEIVIRVTDNGPGVPASLVSTMFEPFVSSGRENGTGLGLTMAQHIAQEHGGSVRLEESAPGKTVFLLRLDKHALNKLRGRSLAAAQDAEATDSRYDR
jgi:signal transduction histidine kinase